MCHERWALHVVIKRKFFLHLYRLWSWWNCACECGRCVLTWLR